MSADPYPDLSDDMKRRIASGQVPPPRTSFDPPDRARDLRFAIASAGERGDTDAVSRLSAEWLLSGATSNPHEGWQSPGPAAGSALPTDRDGLLRLAKNAAEAGDTERANVLQVKAMQASRRVDPDLHDRIAEADDEGDWKTADRLRAEALMQAGGIKPTPPAPPAPQPETVEELNAAIAESEAAGDQQTINRLNAQKLVLARQEGEFSAPLT